MHRYDYNNGITATCYCIDTDECIVDNGGCNQTCINTLGSFNCSCNNGFILLEDGVSCAGIFMRLYIVTDIGCTRSL